MRRRGSNVYNSPKKSMADFLGPVHGEKNVSLLAASIKLVNMWKRGHLGALKNGKLAPTIAEMEETYRNYPCIRESVSAIAGMTGIKHVLTPSFTVLLHYAATESGNNARVMSFLERLASGLGLFENDPVYQLRRFLLAQRQAKPGQRRAGQQYVLALLIKAWNFSKSEKPCSRLAFNLNEEFPVL